MGHVFSCLIFLVRHLKRYEWNSNVSSESQTTRSPRNRAEYLSWNDWYGKVDTPTSSSRKIQYNSQAKTEAQYPTIKKSFPFWNSPKKGLKSNYSSKSTSILRGIKNRISGRILRSKQSAKGKVFNRLNQNNSESKFRRSLSLRDVIRLAKRSTQGNSGFNPELTRKLIDVIEEQNSEHSGEENLRNDELNIRIAEDSPSAISTYIALQPKKELPTIFTQPKDTNAEKSLVINFRETLDSEYLSGFLPPNLPRAGQIHDQSRGKKNNYLFFGESSSVGSIILTEDSFYRASETFLGKEIAKLTESSNWINPRILLTSTVGRKHQRLRSLSLSTDIETPSIGMSTAEENNVLYEKQSVYTDDPAIRIASDVVSKDLFPHIFKYSPKRSQPYLPYSKMSV